VEALCYTCHKSWATEPVSHAPVASGDCLACHDPHAGRADPLLVDRPDQLCVRCHDVDSLTTERVKHTAVKEGYCVGCHDSHGGKERGMVKNHGTNLCLPCHDANAPRHLASASGKALIDLTRKVVHKPLVKGDCQYCHTQKHSSQQDSLLARPAVESCYKCHPRFEEKRKYLHGAAKLGDCPVCHDPHSSDNPALIAEKKINDVCFRCHEDDAMKQEWVHQPLKDQGCTACHDPHGSNVPRSLKAPIEGGQLCLTCHKKVVADVTVPHKALERYGCTVCHDPHAGQPSGLRSDVFTLCTACHPKQKNGEHVGSFAGVHKVLGGPDPRRQGKEFSCVSCHAPHGSNSPKILRKGTTVQESCKACH
jgi:predicted CXXCH cytochrome family protein